MAEEIGFIEGGTVTSPKGFKAGATYAGIKTYGEDKLDLGLLLSEKLCNVAGLFTTSAVRSPSIPLTRERIAGANARALVVNSGIANACVGEQGYEDARTATAAAAKHLGVTPEEVLIACTGLIGVELPMALIRSGLERIELSINGGHQLARAILTTDSHPKEGAISFEDQGQRITIGGITKGAGMVNPKMATMLCFLTTDADVERSFLQNSLTQAVDSSFNMLSVDGDSSTNDMVLLFANGAAGGAPMAEGSQSGDIFQEALSQLCTCLTKELARDGEGATRLIEVSVDGASSCSDARMAAKAVVTSNLVKSAVHGADPNWGRIIAALGSSGARVEEDKIGLFINDVCLMEGGRPIPYLRDVVVVLMQGLEVSIRIRLNLGEGRATAWGCDLTEEYVTFNSAYTT